MDFLSLRRDIKSTRLSLDNSEVKALSRLVADNFFKINGLFESSNFFVYNSIKNEVETSEIVDILLKMGKSVSYPVISGENLISAIPTSNEYIKDCFGCKIPKDFTVMDKVDVAVIPLLACDENKNRIGYGKGFYDRYLKSKNCIKIGLAYDFQVVENFVPNPWDVPLDYIITPTRIIGEDYENFSNRQ